MTFIDAGHALGHVPTKMAMQSAIAKAKDMGVAIGVVRNSNHFGAAGVYSTMALDDGMIGIAMTGTSQRSIVPPRARGLLPDPRRRDRLCRGDQIHGVHG